MNKLKLFLENDVESLYYMAKHLYTKTDYFSTLLTVPQLNVLREIFDFHRFSKADSKLVWSHLLNGKLLIQDGDAGSMDSTDVCLINSKSISLRIRSLLWGKATSFFYQIHDAQDNENDIFEILEGDDSDFEDASMNIDEQPQPESTAKQTRAVEEDNDYDDEEESDKETDSEKIKKDNKEDDNSNCNEDNKQSIQYHDGYLILDIKSHSKQPATTNSVEGNVNEGDRAGNPMLTTTKMSTSLNSSDTIVTTQELAIIKSLNNVYHSFENDRETLVKRQKLEVNDKLVNEQPSGKDAKSTESLSNQLSMNIGSASLSLKYLLRLIDNNKEKVPNLTSRELRNLIHDVKKSKSKWNSEDKIGQEELYEACEKVVIELRSYTQHSTPFLTKVSKREAPNYYQIIKKPMDLNTVMKKLKNLEYKSKKDFVNDLMLIWTNCLTYNTDPNHQLRKDAIAMRKKTLSLMPLIPDITIRTKAEIEKEEKELDQKKNQKKNQIGQVSSKKGLKRTSNGTVVTHADSTSPQGTPVTSQATLSVATNTPEPSASNMEDEDSQAEIDEAEGSDFEDDFNEELNDLEIQVWKNYTSKLRGDFLLRRSNLFIKDDKELKLNVEAEAVLRDPAKMSEFIDVVSAEDTSAEQRNLRDMEEYDGVGDGAGDDLYLTEYDIINGVPLIKYKGQGDSELSKKENQILEKLKLQRKLNSKEETEYSEFTSPKNGLNKVILDNIGQMQEIRKVCFKISLIRQMQQNQFIHHTQLKAPIFEKIQDLDLDPLQKRSESVIFDHKFNSDFIYSIFRKNIGKILMNTGFETADPSAVDTIAQIAETFLGNLIKTIKLHLETSSQNRMTNKQNILLLSLVENGIPKPDDLFIYIKEGIIKQNSKLKELRNKLSNFLKELLRPSLLTFQNEKDLINEKNFTDNSEQFLTGDFSNELGEDFFGFRELGLDKEFHMLSSSIPLHLLNSRLNNSLFNSQSSNTASQTLIEEFDKNIKYKRLKLVDIDKEIKLAYPFLKKFFDKSRVIYLKNFKNNNTSNKDLPFTNKDEEMLILEDEDLPQKQRNMRPRLPPNGKITVVKKKTVGNSFFLPEEDSPEVSKPEKN